MHRMMCTFLAVLFSTMNRTTAFGDASNHGVCAVVYPVVAQVPGVTQGLIAAKSRLTWKSLTISRWELVLGPIAVNLSTNVRAAREGLNMTEDIQ